MQIVGCIGTLTMQEKEDLIEMKVEKEDKFFVINVTILDGLKGIAEHRTTNIMNKEGMYMYFSYVTTLDKQ